MGPTAANCCSVSSSSSSMESWRRSWIWRLIDTTSRIHIWETGWWCALKKKKELCIPPPVCNIPLVLSCDGWEEEKEETIAYPTVIQLYGTVVATQLHNPIARLNFSCTVTRWPNHSFLSLVVYTPSYFISPTWHCIFPHRLGNSRINWHYANISVKCECSQRARLDDEGELFVNATENRENFGNDRTLKFTMEIPDISVLSAFWEIVYEPFKST